MITIEETKKEIEKNQKDWSLYLMSFVDDFRHCKSSIALEKSFVVTDDRMDPLLASTSEYLCKELQIECPKWIRDIPACKKPFFVSGVENLKAMALMESPLIFRIRKIFVLRNFLERV